jgi:hypothetical protein
MIPWTRIPLAGRSRDRLEFKPATAALTANLQDPLGRGRAHRLFHDFDALGRADDLRYAGGVAIVVIVVVARRIVLLDVIEDQRPVDHVGSRFAVRRGRLRRRCLWR